MDPRVLKDVGHAKIGKTTLSLLEEKDALVASTVVVAHADRLLVPDDWLPELEPDLLRDRLGNEHRFGVAEEIEMRVLAQHPVDGGEEFAKAGVREDREPVIARGLAVLQPSGGTYRAVLLERLVWWIGDNEIYGLGGQLFQPRDGVGRRHLERSRHSLHAGAGGAAGQLPSDALHRGQGRTSWSRSLRERRVD